VTEQRQRPPAPPRPAIPIESEDDDIPQDLTIDISEIDLSQLPPPPPPPDEEDESTQIFIAYDEPPMPVGGLSVLHRHLVYPEIARKAGIEGRVILQVFIHENGSVGDIKVVQSLQVDSFDQAAINAVKSVEWIPAKQRDRVVGVWVAVPITFRLE
jgi:protein TonB